MRAVVPPTEHGGEEKTMALLRAPLTHYAPSPGSDSYRREAGTSRSTRQVVLCGSEASMSSVDGAGGVEQKGPVVEDIDGVVGITGGVDDRRDGRASGGSVGSGLTGEEGGH
jgi:hypothetical protein